MSAASTEAPARQPVAGGGASFWAAWRFARRELRGGLRSFRVFLACLALGVAGIAAVGSVVQAIEAGLRQEGRSLLGGDVSLELVYRVATPEERAAFDALGAVSEIYDFRGMARTEAGDAAQTQAKAVDAAYPLYGEVVLDPPIPLADALAAGADGRPGAVIERALATRLDLQVGDTALLGDGVFEVRAIVEEEPDRAVGGFQIGPRFLFSSDALESTGLVAPGTLYETEYRLKLPPEMTLAEARRTLKRQFGEAGWQWRDRDNGAPGVRRFVRRLGEFLTLVGLAALAVGGVGVGASVRAYLDRKTDTIATLKTLGADGRLVVWTYLLQIGALAALGVGLGLLLGAAAPLLAASYLQATLPVPSDFGLYARPLVEAGIYGLLAAFLFAIWPLARAREVRAAGLFRDLVSPSRAWPRLSYLALIVALGAALTGAAVFFTWQPILTLSFVGGVLAALVALRLAAAAIGWVARALARGRLARGRLPLRLALSSIGGPSGETHGVVMALGLGLTVLTAIGLMDVNLRRLVSDTLPTSAPAYFFVDIQDADLAGFKETAGAQPGVNAIETAPMLRGVITRVNGIASSQWRAQGNVADGFGWVLRGDRGVTYAEAPSPDNPITEGDWWSPDYAGTPLVSFGDEQGKGIGLKLGDEITVNILGRDVTARVAAFHHVDFRQMGINFLMIFDPATLRGAPHVHIATVYGDEPVDGAYLRSVARAFPAVTAIRVEEALETVSRGLADVSTAARAGAAATLLTGLVVLIGASAAGQRRAIYDSAILKTLGAPRGQILMALTLRSALLGLAAGVVAVVAGAIGAWGVVTYVFNAAFVFDWATAIGIVAGGVLATLITGALFVLGPLSARPARVLRARD